MAARVATRPVSSRRCSLSRALALRVLVLVGLLRWRVEKGEEDLRRRRGFVDLGMALVEIYGGLYLGSWCMCLWVTEGGYVLVLPCHD